MPQTVFNISKIANNFNSFSTDSFSGIYTNRTVTASDIYISYIWFTFSCATLYIYPVSHFNVWTNKFIHDFCGSGIIIGQYRDGQQPGNCRLQVERIRDYLLQSSY